MQIHRKIVLCGATTSREEMTTERNIACQQDNRARCNLVFVVTGYWFFLVNVTVGFAFLFVIISASCAARAADLALSLCNDNRASYFVQEHISMERMMLLNFVSDACCLQ